MKVSTKGDIENAKYAMILLHGRGATSENILSLANEFSNKEFVYLAPQAPGREWYPRSFMRPREENEPKLSESLDIVDNLIKKANEKIPIENIILIGFSQGACLSLEYAARNPQKYKGVIAFSGGLIGQKLPKYKGDLSKTTVFIGCNEDDPYIPLERVNKSVEVMKKLNANVTKKIFPGAGHSIYEEEIDFVKNLIES